jgi:dihydrofolate reductase
MKVILYMAITANGMIAKADGNSDFTSEADNASFNATCRRIGTVISGRKTYDVLSPDHLPLQQGIHWVLTRDAAKTSKNPTVKFTKLPPEQLVRELEKLGTQKACLIGGQQTITQFAEKGLIDEIYLDVEPLIYGQGMALFADENFEIGLELLGVKKLSPRTIQLHYRIEK